MFAVLLLVFYILSGDYQQKWQAYATSKVAIFCTLLFCWTLITASFSEAEPSFLHQDLFKYKKLLLCIPFFISAPIFVFREFMRHRIASYNEESGRYRELKPVFYIPSKDRKLVQIGKAGSYTFVEGTPEQYEITVAAIKETCKLAYANYQKMLTAGVAREVARAVLPVTLYSSMYVTMNARALMNFLSLRTAREGSHFPSYPQREIEMVAEKMEAHFAKLMPITYGAFEKSGRIAP